MKICISGVWTCIFGAAHVSWTLFLFVVYVCLACFAGFLGWWLGVVGFA